MLGSHHRFWTFVGSLMLLGAAAPGCGGGTDGGNGGGTGSGGDDDDAGLVPGEDGSVRPSDGGAGHDAGDGATGAQLDGEAPPPGPDAGCSVNGCTVGVCMTDGVCDPTATDGEKDGAETDTDCGGALNADGTTNSSSDGAAACVDGKSCLVGVLATKSGSTYTCPAQYTCMQAADGGEHCGVIRSYLMPTAGWQGYSWEVHTIGKGVNGSSQPIHTQYGKTSFRCARDVESAK